MTVKSRTERSDTPPDRASMQGGPPNPRDVRRCTACALLFFLAFFLLFSSGRMNAGDAGAQLEASLLLVNTGSLGTDTPPGDEVEKIVWIQNPHGVWYQAHDIGNIGLMLPAALIGSVVTHGAPRTKVDHPPVVSKILVSLTYAVFSGLGCFFLFRMFCLFTPLRTAFLLALAFATTGLFWAYAKSAWDVTGACVSVCLLLYATAKLAVSPRPSLVDAVWPGLALALVAAFRYSTAPFLLLATVAILVMARPRVTAKHLAAFGTALFAGMLPTFVYNAVRMGSPLRPATTHPKFAITSDLHGNILYGLYTQILAPNRGLLVYAPIFLLLFLLPFVWKRIPLSLRQMGAAYGIGAALYILLIAKIRGLYIVMGWGPRYMVPILPILFFLVVLTLAALWSRYRRPLIALLAVSFALNLVPALVNWRYADRLYPDATNINALLPSQQIATWRGLLLGLQGKPLPMPPDIANDPIRSAGARFPDLWTVRLMERGKAGLLAGLVISLFLVGATVLSYRAIQRTECGETSFGQVFQGKESW